MPGWKSTYYLSEGSGLFAMQSLFLCLIRSELCFHTEVHRLGTQVRHYLTILNLKGFFHPIYCMLDNKFSVRPVSVCNPCATPTGFVNGVD